MKLLNCVVNTQTFCDLRFENDAPSSEGIAKDEIINSICADMEALLTNLTEE